MKSSATGLFIFMKGRLEVGFTGSLIYEGKAIVYAVVFLLIKSI